MRALVVVNPNATTTSTRTRDVLIAALSNDLDLEVAETTHRGHATELATRARHDGLDLVVSVGGDGTVNEIVNGILGGETSAQPHQVPALGIIPGGSTNVLGRNLGIPGNPVEATGLLLDALHTGRRQPVGLGKVGDRYFTFTAGAGLDADVVHAVEQERARGRTASVPLYARTAVRRYFRQPDRHAGPMTIRGDASADVSGLAVVVVSNCTPWTYVGARPLRPSPEADFNAGLDLFGLTSLALPSTVVHIAQMATRRGPRGRHVVSWHDQSRITITSSEPVPVQVDGDFVGWHDQLVLTSVPDAIMVAY